MGGQYFASEWVDLKTFKVFRSWTVWFLAKYKNNNITLLYKWKNRLKLVPLWVSQTELNFFVIIVLLQCRLSLDRFWNQDQPPALQHCNKLDTFHLWARMRRPHSPSCPGRLSRSSSQIKKDIFWLNVWVVHASSQEQGTLHVQVTAKQTGAAGGDG